MTEQELILTSVLNCQRVDLYTDNMTLSKSQQNEIDQIQARRQNDEPLQYVLGSCNFMDLEFFVDQRVLIPRPETEILVESVLKYAQSEDKKIFKILDIGAGSGNIAISLAHNIEKSECISIDVSVRALEVAKQNAQRHKVEDKIEFICADFLSPQEIVTTDKKFDIIISNPPYIKSDDIAHLPLDVRQEPKMALDGGKDGLSFYRAIADYALKSLDDNGKIFLEIGDGQVQDVQEIFLQKGIFTVRECLKDYREIERILIMERAHA